MEKKMGTTIMGVALKGMEKKTESTKEHGSLKLL